MFWRESVPAARDSARTAAAPFPEPARPKRHPAQTLLPKALRAAAQAARVQNARPSPSPPMALLSQTSPPENCSPAAHLEKSPCFPGR